MIRRDALNQSETWIIAEMIKIVGDPKKEEMIKVVHAIFIMH
jgi:hypothetical protein